MDALVSDQGAGAIVYENGDYFWFEESGARHELRASEIPQLLTSSGDFYAAKPRNDRELQEEISSARIADEALLLVLTLLDADASPTMRARSAQAVERSLSSDLVRNRLANLLWAHPSDGSDFPAAITAATNYPVLVALLRELEMAQPYIAELRERWDTLPVSTFGDDLSRENVEYFIVRRGAFREAVKAAMGGREQRAVLRDLLEKKTADVKGAAAALDVWLAHILQTRPEGSVLEFKPRGKTWPKASSGDVSNRSQKIGVVTSTKMQKTVVVSVDDLVLDSRYQKYIKRTNTFKAHDELQKCQVGDRVVIQETRPLSKTKRWCVVRIVKFDERVREDSTTPRRSQEAQSSFKERRRSG